MIKFQGLSFSELGAWSRDRWKEEFVGLTWGTGEVSASSESLSQPNCHTLLRSPLHFSCVCVYIYIEI
jgi:hypothetical protein